MNDRFTPEEAKVFIKTRKIPARMVKANARKPKAVQPKSEPEELFALQLRVAKLPEPIREYRGIPGRDYRFDFCWPDRKIAVEIEGGDIWRGNSRHTHGSAYISDCRKYNSAIRHGWQVYRYPTALVNDKTAISEIESIFKEA